MKKNIYKEVYISKEEPNIYEERKQNPPVKFESGISISQNLFPKRSQESLIFCTKKTENLYKFSENVTRFLRELSRTKL